MSWKLDMTNPSLLSFHLSTTSDSKCDATLLFGFTGFTHSCGSLIQNSGIVTVTWADSNQ